MDISKLYDNFLARFKFFRDFIKVLSDFQKELTVIQLQNSDLEYEVNRLKTENETLFQRLSELPKKENGTDFIQGSASIRDQFYKRYTAGKQ